VKYEKAVALLFVVGCSSGSDAGPKPADAGLRYDAASLDGGGESDAADGLARCGAAPSVTYTLKALELLGDGTAALLEGATLSFDVCPGVTAVTNVSGLASVDVPRGVPFIPRVTAPGHVTVLFGETLVPVSDPTTEQKTEALVPILPAPPALPAYSPTAPLLVVDILGSAASVQISVTGHPEAKMHCMLPTWPSDPTDSIVCGASLGPVVFFSGVAAGTVQLTASTGASSITGLPLTQTGNFPLEDGALTVANIRTP